MIHQRLQLLPRILTASLLVVLIFGLQMGGAIAQALPTTSSASVGKPPDQVNATTRKQMAAREKSVKF